MKSVGLLVIAMLFLRGTVNAERTVWYVHPDSTLNTIQAGLDSCADYDIVLVSPGTYYENIIWPNTQGIHLISELGPEMTIIDGDSAGSVVEITSGVDSTTMIRGFTLQNGDTHGDTQAGGGIYCTNSRLSLRNVTISGNTAYSFYGYGGGIFCDSSSLSLTNATISGNSAGGWVYAGGGGICCVNSHLSLVNVTINDNGAGAGGFWSGAGGGIFCDNSSLNLTNVTIDENSTQRSGGGIYCYNSSLSLTNATISGNSVGTGGGMFSGLGGGILFMDSTNTSLENVSVSGNTAYDGGGIYCYNSSPSLSNVTISENTASSRGGGIFCRNSFSTISGNTISGNTSMGAGGGIYLHESSPTISDNTISGNMSMEGGGGIGCYDNSSPMISYNDIYDNIGFGVFNEDTTIIVSADSNWWGDATGPYHPTANPSGLGDTVSDYVDFEPWLSWPVGVVEQQTLKPIETHENIRATIFRGPLQLPKDKKCKVFDITGRVVEPSKIKPGIYFIEVDGVVTQKVVKVR